MSLAALRIAILHKCKYVREGETHHMQSKLILNKLLIIYYSLIGHSPVLGAIDKQYKRAIVEELVDTLSLIVNSNILLYFWITIRTNICST